MVDPTLPLPGLSPVAGKEVVARFDGGRLSSDGGLLVLREIERRLGIAVSGALSPRCFDGWDWNDDASVSGGVYGSLAR
jgi:hypothetical protein